jgi:hypothetical protein
MQNQETRILSGQERMEMNYRNDDRNYAIGHLITLGPCLLGGDHSQELFVHNFDADYAACLIESTHTHSGCTCAYPCIYLHEIEDYKAHEAMEDLLDSQVQQLELEGITGLLKDIRQAEFDRQNALAYKPLPIDCQGTAIQDAVLSLDLHAEIDSCLSTQKTNSSYRQLECGLCGASYKSTHKCWMTIKRQIDRLY